MLPPTWVAAWMNQSRANWRSRRRATERFAVTASVEHPLAWPCRRCAGHEAGHEEAARDRGRLRGRGSGGLDVLRPGALGARLDLELHLLPAGQAVEIERGGEAVAVEEVVLAV